MEELYLSWKDCVGQAYARYQVILDDWRSGRMPVRKQQPTDLLVRLSARIMEQSEQIRNIRKGLFRDFRETAVGMMENIQETEETAAHFLGQLSDDLLRNLGHERKD